MKRLDVENIGLGVYVGLFIAAIYYCPAEAICPLVGIVVCLWVLKN